MAMAGITLTVKFSAKFGRRSFCLSLISSSVMISIACAVLDNFELYHVTVWLHAFNYCVLMGFDTVFKQYLTELFPSTNRVDGVGIVGSIGTVGPLLAPFILILSRNPSLWYIIYIFITVINFIILFCLSLLPETANFSLPQTVIDAVAATKDTRRNSAVQALIMNSNILTTIGEVFESKKIETKFAFA